MKWLREKEYFYLVVSRKRHREFNENSAVTVKKDKRVTVKVRRAPNEETGEIELYCHSTKREGKERAIIDRFSKRLEEDLTKLDLGLNKKGTVKKYDKILERIGRLKEKYSRIARQYEIKVEKNEETGNAQWVKWKRKVSEDLFPGVYCLRTNKTDWNESTLWHTYTMLTDVESVFRSLKSELGLRPIYHQKSHRGSAHLFITMLAYHIVHSIRYQLKNSGINSSWETLRTHLKGQVRITATMTCSDGRTLHIRKSTRPESWQQEIYSALNLSPE